MSIVPPTKEQMIDKIRKLMAMADRNSGATEAEMETALGMAQSLMMRYAIDADAVRPKDERPDIRSQQTEANYMAYATQLASAAAHLNMSKIVYHTLRGAGVNGHRKFTFIGRPEGIEASQILFDQLLKEVDRLYKMNMPKHLPQSQRGKYRDNFKWGCSVRIQQRVWRMMEEMRNNDLKAIERTGSTALVVSATIDKRLGEIKDWMSQEFGAIKSVARRGRSGHGLTEGLKAGDQATIRTAIK